ncbi:hypothetical protein RFI_24572, partial [Reticulomyxa filosa]
MYCRYADVCYVVYRAMIEREHEQYNKFCDELNRYQWVLEKKIGLPQETISLGEGKEDTDDWLVSLDSSEKMNELCDYIGQMYNKKDECNVEANEDEEMNTKRSEYSNNNNNNNNNDNNNNSGKVVFDARLVKDVRNPHDLTVEYQFKQ